jgi:anaerobic ribonucleoside-triphosphate reductase activating protein
MASARLLVSLIHYPVQVLGPGVRVGLWTQGCSIQCKGCMSMHTWPFDERYARPVEEIAEALLTFPCDALTISGGEPLDQAEALLALLKAIRPSYQDILLYTGYTLGYLKRHHSAVLSYIDALVDGPFRKGLETSAAYKGSENQRFFLLTPALAEKYKPWVKAEKNKSLQVALRAEGVYLIGIPHQKDYEAIRHGLSQNL